MKKVLVAMSCLLPCSTFATGEFNLDSDLCARYFQIAMAEMNEAEMNEAERNVERGRQALDSRKRAAYYQKAALANNAEGQVLYGKCLLLGVGVDKNKAKAVGFFKKAAEHLYDDTGIIENRTLPKGCTLGIIHLGECLLSGTGIAKNVVSAIRLFDKVSKRGDKLGKVCCNELLYSPLFQDCRDCIDGSVYDSFESHLDESLRMYENDEDDIFIEIIGTIDPSKVDPVERDAAALRRQQNACAQMCVLGEFFRPMTESEKSCLKRKADNGDVNSQASYGMYLFTGKKGVKQNRAEAVRYFRLVAEQGNIRAQSLYGGCLLCGIGIEANLGLALDYIQNAAQYGDELAQELLNILNTGRGVDVLSAI